MMNKQSIGSLLLVLLCAACSTAPEIFSYILPNPPLAEVEHLNKGCPVVLFDDVAIADFLQKQGFVVEEGEHRIVVTRHHRWGESLKDGVRRYLTRKLTNSNQRFRFVSSGDFRGAHLYKLELQMDGFHSIRFDQVRGVGRWYLRDLKTGNVVIEDAFDIYVENVTRDYEGIVSGLSGVLDGLSVSMTEQFDAFSL